MPQRRSRATPGTWTWWVESVSLGNAARSTARTFRPRRARSSAVEAPATRAPTTMTSYMSYRCGPAWESSHRSGALFVGRRRRSTVRPPARMDRQDAAFDIALPHGASWKPAARHRGLGTDTAAGHRDPHRASVVAMGLPAALGRLHRNAERRPEAVRRR